MSTWPGAPAMRGVRLFGRAGLAFAGGVATFCWPSGCATAAVAGTGGLAARAPAASFFFSSGGKAW